MKAMFQKLIMLIGACLVGGMANAVVEKASQKDHVVSVKKEAMFQLRFLYPVANVQGENFYDVRDLEGMSEDQLSKKRVEGSVLEGLGSNILTLKMIGYEMDESISIFILDSKENSYVVKIKIDVKGREFYEILPEEDRAQVKKAPLGHAAQLMLEVLRWKVAKVDHRGVPFKMPSSMVLLKPEESKAIEYSALQVKIHPKEVYVLKRGWWVLVGDVENLSNYERLLDDWQLAGKKGISAIYLKPNRMIIRRGEKQLVTFLKKGEKSEVVVLFKKRDSSALDFEIPRLGTVKIKKKG